MNPESESNEGKAAAKVPPLRRDIRSPGTWRYFINYLMLGSSAVIIFIEIIQSGVWRSLWAPLILIVIAMMNLADMQAAERRNAQP
jgi:DMSO reductase anchor subunit